MKFTAFRSRSTTCECLRGNKPKSEKLNHDTTRSWLSLSVKSLSSVDSRPEDSSLLQTSPLLIENKRQPPDKMHNQVTETDTPILMDIRSFGNVDTFMPPPLPPAQYFTFFPLVIAYT